MIRKKFKLHIGKTTMRRAKAKVLKDMVGDHVVEFEKILDYKDELLRTNPGTTITDVLPKCEHRMCASILANWAKDWMGLQRRQQVWKIAKSTFESQLRKNIEKMKVLGPEKMMYNLMYYNVNFWCKVYFNIEVKCDSVDNNMSECFNAWILVVRHKIIITMLEE
ncbi:hypothetical protein H5410_032193 [Solanum commersonii]|uniref:Uncharacterized protein n=1 Tax=Solanum commersonii TaxID=4109 RepID=A0A9J5YM67_SOLCO|nr:hypothetical protein H5410_032193 [Solanum commersonii]